MQLFVITNSISVRAPTNRPGFTIHRDFDRLCPIFTIVEDNYKHKGMRRKLLETLRQKGIQDEAVLQALWDVPRHWFLDRAFEELAYEDKAFPIDKDQSISQPYTVARMTELLDVKKHQKVLEIGTGSGYQAAILHQLGARVFTVERQRVLYQKSKAFLKELGYSRIRCFYKDGMTGLDTYAPFDRIIVTAAAETVPQPLLDQLAPGGILVVPVGSDVQEMLRIIRVDETTFKNEVFGQYRFVPFLGGLDAG
ncbi:MAG: protein-L-isoaspartate(D-aspartate) O-methyltransferase [Saprospiraceae bacterium]|nr:protein-L-isoaspartate(D-aspartate) O-methyltransferase [Saprospiraceae bacterium]